ncbi:MAG TPA: hypothetical protein DDZ80_27450 [Cyanobacteria bacterium UBA8803]|nr:hypothetical protein [Cyanobacteria bacterium UBA8803]
MLGLGSSYTRYASLDTYVCVTCGYIESYVTSPEDLNYIKEHWASVSVSCNHTARSLENSDHIPVNGHDELTSQAPPIWEN